MTIIKIFSLACVFAGMVLLAVSLRPTGSLINREEPQSRGWQILFYLILFFVVGYAVFGYTLFSQPIAAPHIIVSIILFGGGCFVAIISRMSVTTIANVRRIAALERHRALHDELTDLPNRALLHERIEQGIKLSDRNSKPLAILLMDLDRFKEINDTLGHHCGDFLLQQVAPRLRHSVRTTDTVSRLGGDEFAVVLPDAGLDQAIAVSEKIVEVMEQDFSVEGHSLNVGISIGISLYPQHGKDSAILLQRSDVAMYNAKRNSLNYSVYDAEYDQYSVNRLRMVADLRDAIQNDRLFVEYQPIVSIGDGRVEAIEALVRWQYDADHVCYPEDFIELAEQTGLIKPLTVWLLNNVFKKKEAWKQRGLDLPISINISIKSLQDVSFPDQLFEKLEQYNVDPEQITLEITETSMMVERSRTYDVISQLHNRGLMISIDDFGTGYSSLSYLKQLPIKEIKIDQSFVADMLEDDNDAIIVRSTIDLAHNMGRRIIAEGVENQDLFDLLEILGCDAVQGYHICPPLDVVELEKWLQQNPIVEFRK